LLLQLLLFKELLLVLLSLRCFASPVTTAAATAATATGVLLLSE